MSRREISRSSSEASVFPVLPRKTDVLVFVCFRSFDRRGFERGGNRL